MTPTRARDIVRRAACLSVGLALLSTAPASSAGDGATAALAESRATAARLVARAGAIHADLTSGSFEQVVRRLAAMAGLEAPRTPAPDAGRLRGLPSDVAAPVADLLAAATFAADGMKAAVRADGGRHRTLMRRTDRLAHEIVLAFARGERLPAKAALALKAEVTSSPILRAAAAGGLAIGAALDRSLEPLRAAAASLPRTGRDNHGCDVLDQVPILCVAGTDANETHEEAVLVVDLGGDDTYESSAGGANSARCVDDPDDTSCNASVLVDVSGNDTYLLEPSISHDHLVGAGSAMVGIGVLVDAAGDDRYLADVTDRDFLDISYVFGSGTFGLGLLADLTGNDRYEMTARPNIFNPYTHGASLDGMGALLDMDGENVYRIVESGEQLPNLELPLAANRFVNSMGTGVFGAGALVDRTGYATFEARIDTTAGAQRFSSLVNTVTHGTGLIGEGALFAGSGPTTYESIARRVATASMPGQSADPVPDEDGFTEPTARIPGMAQSTGMGIGVLGIGIMQDSGGDDVYRSYARSEHRLTVTAAEGCGCDRAIATLDTTGWDDFFGGPFDEATTGVSTQGVASSLFVPDAGALVHDLGGDDVYTARAEMVISSRAENLLDDPSGGARAESIPARAPAVNAFGQGIGSDFSPTVLLDEGGDDSYELVAYARNDASAEAGEGPAKASSLGTTVANHGQGTSYWDPAQGSLLDLGGRDDYQAHAISRATASPGPGAQDVPRTIKSQGSVGGVLADLDEGLADTFSATPEPGTVAGLRGEGPGWVDISAIFPGYGFAPLQPAKRDVSLTMDPANPPQTTGGWVPFRARLTDAGVPLEGREVIFTFEWQFPDITGLGTRWLSRELRSHAITDDDGWATGYLLFEPTEEPTEEVFRIAARFEGDARSRTALASQPFMLR